MSYEKTNGILLPRKYLNFPSVKVIVTKIASEIIKDTKNDHFLMAHYRKVAPEFFSGLREYNIGQKLVQDDQVYQSHQLSTDLDAYR